VDSNINVFGLAFIFSLSVFCMLVDITILRFLIFLSRFRRALSPRIEHWIQDGVLQLQRRAYEAQDIGTWVDVDKEFPKTDTRELLPAVSSFSLMSTVKANAAEGVLYGDTKNSVTNPTSRASSRSISVDCIAIDFPGPNREDTLVTDDPDYVNHNAKIETV
jgi:hypothetical protein